MEPSTGEEIEAVVKEVMDQPPEVIALVKRSSVSNRGEGSHKRSPTMLFQSPTRNAPLWLKLRRLPRNRRLWGWSGSGGFET